MLGALALGCGDGGGESNGEESATGGGLDTDSGPATVAGTGATSMASGSADGTGATATGGPVDGTADGSGSTGEEVDEGPGIDLQCNGQGGADPDDGVICFYDVESMDMGPAANLEYELVDFNGQDAIYIRVVFAPWFVDNTYGDTQIGWPDGHEFKELTGSDRANIVMSNAAGDVVLDFDLDYLEDDDNAPSGFRSQGVWEKNGGMNVGEQSAILAANSSLSRNLNERGYDQYLEDSPATDDLYTPNPAAPDWDFRVVYEVWVDASLFGMEQVDACVRWIHASPAKSDDNTMEVVPDECPPGWDCYEVDGCADCEPYSDPDMGGDCEPTGGIPQVP
ncbi:MAG: hypothetical protein AAGF11_34365 [Myxococcota bacterium]